MSIAFAIWLLALAFYGSLALALGFGLRDWEFVRPWFLMCMIFATIACGILGAALSIG